MNRTLTIHDIFAARKNVYRFLAPTPLYSYPVLNQLIGADVWVKHENHQPVGSFKVRGGLNLAANLKPGERKQGLFTASTGNHGQSIAYSAKAYDIRSTIVVPEGANPTKVDMMRGLDAEIIFHGKDFDAAREYSMELAKEKGGLFVGPTENALIAGVGTYALEIMSELPEVDTIIVPVGAGSGASGTCIAVKSINPGVTVIAAQSIQAPSMQLSWKSGELICGKMETFAEGLATRVPFPNTQKIMQEYLDDFVLVDDKDIRQAIIQYLEHTHNLAEGAGAVALAAALNMKSELAGKKVVLILSGGNLSREKLRSLYRDID